MGSSLHGGGESQQIPQAVHISTQQALLNPNIFLPCGAHAPPPSKQGFWAEPERGRKGGKKRSHVSLGREGKRKRSTSSETEIVTKTQGESQRKGDTKDGGRTRDTKMGRKISLLLTDHPVLP